MADTLSRRHLAHSDKIALQVAGGCYTQATCLATLRKVEDRSTSLATRNATIAVAKWGVTREFSIETCNATCNMAFSTKGIAIPSLARARRDELQYIQALGKACKYNERRLGG